MFRLKRSSFTRRSSRVARSRMSDVASVLPSSTKMTSHVRPRSVSRRRASINGMVSASFRTGITIERSMNAFPSALVEDYGESTPGQLSHRTISPAMNQQAGCAAFILFGQGSGRVGGECRADVGEGSVDIVGESRHTGWRSKGDQRNHQCILNQILTLFPLHHVSESWSRVSIV